MTTQLSPSAAAAAPLSDADRAAFSRDWDTWHAAHEANRADDHGFLAVSAIHWLGAAPERFDDAPGAWSSTAGTATDAGPVVELGDGESIVVAGETITGRYEFGTLAERSGVNAQWTRADGGVVVLEIAKRGGNDILRPRHPDTAILTEYRGTPVYPPNPRWAIRGTYRAFDEPRSTTVGSVADGLEHVYDAPGEVSFDHRGESFTLTAFAGHAPGSLLVLFTDATSGITTYAANRALSVAAPAADGSVVLDFNRATNLPCAYTPHATCPLPPAENRLPIGVEAGEKLPLAPATAPAIPSELRAR